MHPSFRHATLAVVLFFAAFTAHAKTASEVYEQAAKSTVVVENIDAKGKAQSMGSGVVFADGDVVTNCHVIKGANKLKVRIGGKEHSATLRSSVWAGTAFYAPARARFICWDDVSSYVGLHISYSPNACAS